MVFPHLLAALDGILEFLDDNEHWVNPDGYAFSDRRGDSSARPHDKEVGQMEENNVLDLNWFWNFLSCVVGNHVFVVGPSMRAI